MKNLPRTKIQTHLSVHLVDLGFARVVHVKHQIASRTRHTAQHLTNSNQSYTFYDHSPCLQLLDV